MTEQVQITNGIEYLVFDELIFITQPVLVQHAKIIDDDRVIHAAAERQVAFSQRLDVAQAQARLNRNLLTRCGDSDTPVGPVHKLSAERRFEFLDGITERGLADETRLRGAAEAQQQPAERVARLGQIHGLGALPLLLGQLIQVVLILGLGLALGALVYLPISQQSLGGTPYAFDLRFTAPILPEREPGAALDAGGGAPGAAYTALIRAMHAKELDTLLLHLDEDEAANLRETDDSWRSYKLDDIADSAPEQMRVLPITDAVLDYAEKVTEAARAQGIRAELDRRSEKLGYKIRDGETMKVPYLLVVGQREAEQDAVALRLRHRRDEGVLPVAAVVDLVVFLRRIGRIRAVDEIAYVPGQLSGEVFTLQPLFEMGATGLHWSGSTPDDPRLESGRWAL